MKQTIRKENHIRCRFCEWIEDSQWKKSVEGNSRIIDENKYWIACLDKFPKVEGHTLLISKNPYDDISDINRISDEEAIAFFTILQRVTQKLKSTLEVSKVYLMSICEHHRIDEIIYSDKKTSEHLHFHLLPYNKERLLEGESPETIFS
jgi:diadenosine tetraphosphate (Ap4A) HIT family hydrolase